ncbi:uncharacterized protein KD926_006424 [Aspergillus affinis]|uniref:uncharacterized protein n=1 Tax=Aspergillus affinis TaxID=1070780 RepID=UPI0022FDD116|nr:uncharacterized protein KD926_006424 [Aspergillus affinis]KAI9041878.1 hypothetical protein KD926_006424 [Aspergillus affinis]
MHLLHSLFATGIGLRLVALVAGHTDFSTEQFTGTLDGTSGVLRSLKPKGTSETFDFSPADVFDKRNGNGNYHTGDLTLRYRVGDSGAWTDVDTATDRGALNSKKSTSNSSPSAVIASSDLGGIVNASLADDLSITRSWVEYKGDLALNFTVTNKNSKSIELGSLGFPIEWNTIFYERTGEETRQTCVLVDPYIGLDAGYVQVTRLLGAGPHLVITPLGETKFEAWRFLPETGESKLAYQSQVFEGNYEWQVYSKAWAEKEWDGVTPWNKPTSLTLKPGQTVSYGLRFSVVESVEKIEDKVASLGLPVAQGVPGYILPRDLDGKLFIRTNETVENIDVSPGGLTVKQLDDVNDEWKAFSVTPQEDAFGRTRIELKYGSGLTHSLHFYVTDTGPKSLSKLGNYLTETQWFDGTDPFGRSPSIITYDHSADAPVLQDNRVWIAGLSDEGGAGAFVTAAMKQIAQPVAKEIAKLETFVNETVWARLQLTSGENKYGVRKSLFYYDTEAMPDFKYDSDIYWQGAWDKEGANLLDRAYNYVHVTCLYWALYRAGRSSSVLERQSAQWYLEQAYETIRFVYGTHKDGSRNTWYNDLGLMGETVWKLVLDDLKLENYTTEADTLEGIFKPRAQEWTTQEDPFGSEQAWDCTGQEGVYLWTKYFGFTETAQKTIQSIHGFMPTVAHWGWNGNARRYWDFGTAGKIDRIERQIHHYGSSLNALPILDNYHSSSNPTSDLSLYDLRIGYGGNQGPMTNIHQDGFGSMSFHSFPETLDWDPYSGDYGSGFVGHVLGAATYVLKHPTFGWLSYGGNVVSTENGQVVVEPKDSVRQRIYVVDAGLWVGLDSGAITQVSVNLGKKTVVLDIEKGVEGIETVDVERVLVKYSVTKGIIDSEVKLTKGAKDGKYGQEVNFAEGKASLTFAW